MKQPRLLLLLGTVMALALGACGGPTPVAPTATPAALLATGLPTSVQQSEGYPIATPGAPEPTLASDAYPAEPTAAVPASETLPPTENAGPTETPAPVSITYSNFAISPSPVTIKAGTQVTFLIQDSVHQPYAGQAAPFIFEAPPGLQPGASWPYTFNEAGTFNILCGYHGNMTGTVIVEP